MQRPLAPRHGGRLPPQQVTPSSLWPLCWSPPASSPFPSPPLPAPRGLVINSLIIHHYSNHYLPSPGPQRPRRGIQSGELRRPRPLRNRHSLDRHSPPPPAQMPCIDHTHLLSATCTQTLLYSHTFAPGTHRHTHISTHSLTKYSSPIQTHTLFPWVPGGRPYWEETPTGAC